MRRNVVIFAVYLLLILLGIPWYWPVDSRLILFGLPGWVLVAVLVSILASIFTAYLLLSRSWPCEDLSDE